MAKRRSGIQAATNTDTRDRRTYQYKGQTVICFGGGHFAAPAGTKIDPEGTISGVGFEDAKEDSTILVLQNRPGRRPVTETWARIEVGPAERVA